MGLLLLPMLLALVEGAAGRRPLHGRGSRTGATY